MACCDRADRLPNRERMPCGGVSEASHGREMANGGVAAAPDGGAETLAFGWAAGVASALAAMDVPGTTLAYSGFDAVIAKSGPAVLGGPMLEAPPVPGGHGAAGHGAPALRVQHPRGPPRGRWQRQRAGGADA